MSHSIKLPFHNSKSQLLTLYIVAVYNHNCIKHQVEFAYYRTSQPDIVYEKPLHRTLCVIYIWFMLHPIIPKSRSPDRSVWQLSIPHRHCTLVTLRVLCPFNFARWWNVLCAHRPHQNPESSCARCCVNATISIYAAEVPTCAKVRRYRTLPGGWEDVHQTNCLFLRALNGRELAQCNVRSATSVLCEWRRKWGVKGFIDAIMWSALSAPELLRSLGIEQCQNGSSRQCLTSRQHQQRRESNSRNMWWDCFLCGAHRVDTNVSCKQRQSCALRCMFASIMVVSYDVRCDFLWVEMGGRIGGVGERFIQELTMPVQSEWLVISIVFT